MIFDVNNLYQPPTVVNDCDMIVLHNYERLVKRFIKPIFPTRTFARLLPVGDSHECTSVNFETPEEFIRFNRSKLSFEANEPSTISTGERILCRADKIVDEI